MRGMRMSIRITSGRSSSGALDRFCAVARLADHLEVVLRLQEQSEAGPYELLVVDDQQPDAHASSPIGSRAATR